MILVYHGVSPRGPAHLGLDAFERHLEWIRARYEVVPLSRYRHERPRRRTVALTFDDGFANVCEHVLPLLERSGVPAALFVTTGHLDGVGLLWFSYLDALCFGGDHPEVVVESRRLALATDEERRAARATLRALSWEQADVVGWARRIEERYPVSDGAAAPHRGARWEDLRRAADSGIIEIGAHTVTHPFLAPLDDARLSSELRDSREALREITGRGIEAFAYTGGRYDARVSAAVRDAGFERAYALKPQGDAPPELEIERVGVYSPSLAKLRLKLGGLVRVARAVGYPIG